jgi:hypothetical protein
MAGLATLAREGGEEVYTSFISDRFEAALETFLSQDTGPDEWAVTGAKDGPGTNHEAGTGLNRAYMDDGAGTTGWEPTAATVARIVGRAVNSCKAMIPALGAYKTRWDTEDWRRDRPGFDASHKGQVRHFHDVLDPGFNPYAGPVIDVRPQVYESETCHYNKIDINPYQPLIDTAGTPGYSVGTGAMPRSGMVEPTRLEKAKEYMDSEMFQRAFQGASMTGTPLGLGSITARTTSATTSNDRAEAYLRDRNKGISGAASIASISSGFR